MKSCHVCGKLVAIGVICACGVFSRTELPEIDRAPVAAMVGSIHLTHSTEADAEIEMRLKTGSQATGDVTIQLTGVQATFTQGTLTPVVS
jgi:hypothetical protein